MQILSLILAMTFSAMITVGTRLFNTQNAGRENVSSLYNILSPFFALVTWFVCWCLEFSFEINVLPYSILYGIAYTCFTVGMVGALSTGSTSLTALIKQMALVGVSFWGFLFWKTPITILNILGIVLIIISLFLCLHSKEDKSKLINLRKWFFYAILIVIGNAGASIIQRYQQMAFDYQHKYMFMTFGLFFATVICTLLSLRHSKANWKAAFKCSWMYAALAGISMAATNIIVLLLIRYDMSPAIIYPGLAVGGLMITTVISLLFFRERLRPVQWWGLAIGAVALVLLNI